MLYGGASVQLCFAGDPDVSRDAPLFSVEKRTAMFCDCFAAFFLSTDSNTDDSSVFVACECMASAL